MYLSLLCSTAFLLQKLPEWKSTCTVQSSLVMFAIQTPEGMDEFLNPAEVTGDTLHGTRLAFWGQILSFIVCFTVWSTKRLSSQSTLKHYCRKKKKEKKNNNNKKKKKTANNKVLINQNQLLLFIYLFIYFLAMAETQNFHYLHIIRSLYSEAGKTAINIDFLGLVFTGE